MICSGWFPFLNRIFLPLLLCNALAAYFTQATVNGMNTVDDIPCMRGITVPPGMYRRSRSVKKRKESRRSYPVDLPSPVSDPQSSGDEPVPYPACLPFDSRVASPTPPPFSGMNADYDGNDSEGYPAKSSRDRQDHMSIDKFTREKRKVVNKLAPLSYLQSLHHPRRHPADEVVLRAFPSIN